MDFSGDWLDFDSSWLAVAFIIVCFVGICFRTIDYRGRKEDDKT